MSRPAKYKRRCNVDLGEPITPTERIAWAQIALEEACGRLAGDRYRGKAYVEAVVARHAELMALRGAHEATPGRGTRAYHPSHRRTG